MNIEDALRCLFLRLLREGRLAAEAGGSTELAGRLAALADGLAVERDRTAKQYRVTLAGTSHAWTIPDSEFVFYSRGDQVPAGGQPAPTVEDSVYEANLAHARKWLGVFREAWHA
jgi:hypothetical protein